MELRWYQQEAVEAVWRSMRDGNHPCVVAPTGAGKSLIIAEIARQARKWNGRSIILAHRKELLEQNASKIAKLLPGEKVGVYSAGLKRRDTKPDIIVAGIQSIYKRACLLDARHVCVIDEAHLISPDEGTMYKEFLDELQKINPSLRIVGLTATPYRTGEGSVTDGGILNDICYEVPVRRLLEEGYLCQLTNKPTTQVDMRAVDVRRGEYVAKQMEDAFTQGTRVQTACKEIVSMAADRKSVLVFTCGVNHAQLVADELERLTGEDVGLVTGETEPLLRASTLRRFQDGSLRWLVNVNVLTTGFDAPNIDCIAVMRATVSPGLFAQIVGRGFRIHPSKQDCLILDFGGNCQRHGPLDDPEYGRRVKSQSSREAGDAPVKICPKCQAEIGISCVWCPECGGMVREATEPNHEEKADTNAELLKEDKPPEEFQVIEVSMRRHISKDENKHDTLRVDYLVQREEGGNLSEFTISEWVCLDHEAGVFPRRRAMQWAALHTIAEVEGVQHAEILFLSGAMRTPTRITAKRHEKWWRVIDRQFEDERPTEWTEIELEEEEAF